MPKADFIDLARASARGFSERPRIAIAAEVRYVSQRQPSGLALALARSGRHPVLLDPRDLAGSCLLDVDLLVARGRSPDLFDLLERAESLGIATVNRRSAIAAVVDKASMAHALATAGIPTPATRVGSFDAIARSCCPSDFPLVLKPVFGDNARGVRVVWTRDELSRVAWHEPQVIAQPFLPSDGFDLKLYVAGAEVHAVRKPSPLAPDRDLESRPVQVTPALRALALRCGLLFGLELFGVDCVETARGPVVIEVNDFPNYTAVGGADERLARFVVDRAERLLRNGSEA